MTLSIPADSVLSAQRPSSGAAFARSGTAPFLTPTWHKLHSDVCDSWRVNAAHRILLTPLA